MLATCFAAIGCTDAADDGTIQSDGTVTLDITKSYKENQSELAKLGVSGYDCWRYNDEHECYVLTLDDVHFETTSTVGIKFTAPASVDNPKIAIKLVGNNSITSGSVVASGNALEDYYASGIQAIHMGEDGKKKYDITVAFIGDGSIEVKNVNDNNNYLVGSAGLDIFGNLVVAKNAKVTAKGGNITHITHATGTMGKIESYSVGAYVTKTIAVRGQSSLVGTGGSVDLYFTKDFVETTTLLYSEGISAESYYIVDSYVSGTGSYVYFDKTVELPESKNLMISSVSAGISARDMSIVERLEMHAYVSNSKVVGQSGWATGREMAESVGLELAASDKVVIEDSVLIGNSGKVAKSVAGANVVVGAFLRGIEFHGITDITGSYVQGATGYMAINENNDGSTHLYGLYGDSDMTVRDSMLNVRGRGLDNQEWSNGISLYDMDITTMQEETKTLTVIDSEIYASGMHHAIFAKEVIGSPDPRGCYGYKDGGWTSISIDDMIDKDTKSVELLYGYDVIVDSNELGIVGFERLHDDTYVVAQYHGYVPDGKRFAGYKDTDGNDVKVGSTIQIYDYVLLKATFEEKGEAGSNSWVVWVVVIVAVIAIALLVAAAYAWKSR